MNADDMLRAMREKFLGWSSGRETVTREPPYSFSYRIETLKAILIREKRSAHKDYPLFIINAEETVSLRFLTITDAYDFLKTLDTPKEFATKVLAGMAIEIALQEKI